MKTLTATGSVDGGSDALALHADTSFHRRDLSWNLDGVFADSTLDTFALGPRLHWGSGERIALTVGGDAEYDALDFDRYRDFARTQPRGSASLERWTAGVYGHALARVAEPLSLTLTLRQQWHGLDAELPDANASKDGGDTAASLGATWQPAKGLRVFARADRFFRYPALDEVAAFQGYALERPFNEDLESERGWGTELGADWAVGRWMLRATAFAQDVEDMIAFDYNENLNVNLADGRRMGVELGAQWRGGQWAVGAFYTLLKSEFTDGPYSGSELYLVPRHQASGWLAWMPTGWLTLRASVRYSASAYQGNDLDNIYERLPAQAVVDVLARVRFSRQWQAYIGMDNALDRRYASLLYSGGWYPAPGRGLRAGMQWEY
jgi:iron complex outermembrane receptor protein